LAQVVLPGPRAVPRRLEELGYVFRHPELEPALSDILGAG
jgi:NAD dependent epimerase/dehydratase family enzyme